MNPIRLLAVVRKELMQLRRDRLTFAMIVGIPTLQLLLFGFAINLDIRHLPAALPHAPALRREHHLACAAIAGMRPALGKTGGLELVDQLDHGAGIHAHRRAQLLLVRSLETAEQVE